MEKITVTLTLVPDANNPLMTWADLIKYAQHQNPNEPVTLCLSTDGPRPVWLTVPRCQLTNVRPTDFLDTIPMEYKAG